MDILNTHLVCGFKMSNCVKLNPVRFDDRLGSISFLQAAFSMSDHFNMIENTAEHAPFDSGISRYIALLSNSF